MKGLLATKSSMFKQVAQGRYYDNRCNFTKYSRFYLRTNENIAGYIKEANFDNAHKALTVLASGDQYLNLLQNGIIDIDTFDTNYITYYYALGIKRAMIIKYNYNQYLETLKKILNPDTSVEEITAIVYELLPFMEKDIRQFWQKIANYNYKLQKKSQKPLNLFGMLAIDYYAGANGDLTVGNEFLESEEKYNKVKNNIEKANLSFKLLDGAKLSQEYTSKYDVIMLSNIMDYFFFRYDWGEYFGYGKLKEYVDDILNMLNGEGIAFLNYVFPSQANTIIRGSSLWEQSLTREEIIKFKDITGKLEARMLLVRKKDEENGLRKN